MVYPPGSKSVSIDVSIFDNTGLALTGLIAATFPPVYWSVGGITESTLITLSDLALITTSYTSGGVKERAGGVGVYRLDLPDTALVNPGGLTIYAEDNIAGKHLRAHLISIIVPVATKL